MEIIEVNNLGVSQKQTNKSGDFSKWIPINSELLMKRYPKNGTTPCHRVLKLLPGGTTHRKPQSTL